MIIEKLLKRRNYPVPIGGETVNVRALTIRELGKLNAIEHDGRTGFVLGCALLEADGSPSFTQRPAVGDVAAETDVEFANRVVDGLNDVPIDTLAEISAAIEKLGKPVKPETALKN